jgi:transcriptional regulator of acetoin/glycerol metabolism
MDKTLELSFYTKQWLMGLPWLGNVRELKLAIERAVAIASDSGPLHPYHFVNLEASLARKSLPKELEEIERARVEHALGASEWNVTLAAKLLGLSRTTLSSRIKRLGITRPKD